jgi:hypothetical protein
MSSSSSLALQSLQGPKPSHTGGFVTLVRHLIGLLWTSDQSLAKASTYTGQHTNNTHTETQKQTSMPRVGFDRTFH